LLKRKREEREADRRRVQEAGLRRHRTPEERAAALRAMEQDAVNRERNRTQQHSQRQCGEDNGHQERGQATFLTDLTKRAHGIQGDHNVSLSERLRQNRNTNQRAHDSFL
jgi:hypothetical protein